MEIAVIPTRGSERQRRVYRQRAEPGRWTLGLIAPVLLVVATTLFGVTRFANGWIERTASEGVRSALDATGHQWARVEMSGQLARLSGPAPSATAAEQALSVARAAECPTWLGPKVCAVSVAGAFGDVDGQRPSVPATTWLDIVAEIDAGSVTLRGAVPDDDTRQRMMEAVAAGADGGSPRTVVDRLQIVGTRVPEGFTTFAERLAEAASLCASGTIALVEGTLSAQCSAARAGEVRLRDLLQTPPGPGSLGSVSIIVQEDVEVCESRLASLQSDARIEFATGSTTIVAAAGPLLDEIAAVATTCPGALRVEGHTDSTGSPDANRALSQARAEAVRDALTARGVPPGRLIAVGIGQDAPLASNATAEGRARNRRIEFRVAMPGA